MDSIPNIANYNTHSPDTWPAPLQKTKLPITDVSFLDSSLLSIFDNTYKDDLSKEMIAFGSNATIEIKGSGNSPTTYDWNKAYKTYRKNLLASVQEWVNKKLNTPGISEDLDVDIIRSIPSRVHFLTSEHAYSNIPFIRKIEGRIPVFCPYFFIDLAESFQSVSDGIVEVSNRNQFSDIYTMEIYRT